MARHLYIGVDPGVTGAFAVLEDRHPTPTGKAEFVAIHDLPTDPLKPNRIDPVVFHDLINPYILPNPKLWPPATTLTLILETSQGLKSQSATSIFNYGVTTGILRATLLILINQLPFPAHIIDVQPQTWKRALSLLFDPTAPDPIFDPTLSPSTRRSAHAKAQSLQKALDLYPQSLGEITHRKDHNRAEALLLAHYGLLLSTDQILGPTLHHIPGEKRLKPKTLKFDAGDPQ
jgi:crossover junction endodeoxyribonuclease RuvC